MYCVCVSIFAVFIVLWQKPNGLLEAFLRWIFSPIRLSSKQGPFPNQNPFYVVTDPNPTCLINIHCQQSKWDRLWRYQSEFPHSERALYSLASNDSLLGCSVYVLVNKLLRALLLLKTELCHKPISQGINLIVPHSTTTWPIHVILWKNHPLQSRLLGSLQLGLIVTVASLLVFVPSLQSIFPFGLWAPIAAILTVERGARQGSTVRATQFRLAGTTLQITWFFL